MRNSESAYLFTYINIWKVVSIFIKSAGSIPLSLEYNPDKHTHIQHPEQYSFKNIDDNLSNISRQLNSIT